MSCQKHYVPRVRVYPPKPGELDDTFEACEGTRHSCFIYAHGDVPAHFPVPATPLAVRYDYEAVVTIDDVTDPEDPIVVWLYDGWTERSYT